jgi:hypothetical protein
VAEDATQNLYALSSMSFRNLLLMGTVLLPLASRAACVEKDLVGQWEAKLVGLDKKSVIQCRLILAQGLRVRVRVLISISHVPFKRGMPS